MRFVSRRHFGLIAAALFVGAPVTAQQAPDNFRWVDFHSAKEADTIAWVRRSLEPEKWTAIREIGVEYDAALVVTTLRPAPQSTTNADSFTVWTLSLTSHAMAPLLHGVNLRLLDWMLLYEGHPRELAALYDDCGECAATTFFTAFHYDLSQHMWTARWMRGTQAAPVWTANATPGVALTQIYALLTEPSGRQLMGTWSHFDHGPDQDAVDSIFRYDLDPFSALERTQLLCCKEADQMKQRLCAAQTDVTGLARGQDSTLCQLAPKPRVERKPVTTPPSNNHGQSQPPKARH
ncbi:MAG: hypothetical protein ABSC76_07775 [Terracidiphilus sp.]|jgi:hypothetical protein